MNSLVYFAHKLLLESTTFIVDYGIYQDKLQLLLSLLGSVTVVRDVFFFSSTNINSRINNIDL